ncbi:hypothetical protein GWI33_015898 [Rhynchophorus ferrugineus]|uniref:RRM domain-containing protein n=1 Tax=Rhynchophorus ferrugineus TaxID=354439 RepID=A0A834I298_RHYFE|nr:hypothetical protein GWI33_015898 [Rhynchophorus ferrugineus]
MVCKDTLRIKHLPKELSDAQKEDFIKHFGAIKAKVITSKAKAKSVVYAKFENEEISKNVMYRLHQINVLNCRLCVEYADTDLLQGILDNKKVDDVRDAPDQKSFKSFINKINAFNDSVGFYQPPPAHLKYNYPKANRPTINNIAHALATVPRFYTQVLHLMNKMNLPPPFAMPNPPIRTVQPAQQPVVEMKPVEITPSKPVVSDSESEIESDGESNKSKEIIPQKRQISQKKMVKRPKFNKQSVGQVVKKPPEKCEDVFEKVEVQAQRKIELKVNPSSGDDAKGAQESLILKQSSVSIEVREASKTDLLMEAVVNKLSPKVELNECAENARHQEDQPPTTVDQVVKDDDHPVETPKSPEKVDAGEDIHEELSKDQNTECSMETEAEKSLPPIKVSEEQKVLPEDSPASPEDDYPCISQEELAANQISDLSVVPVFKNYNPGAPTNKLYIKNCAKSVVLQDLEYIYNRYREEGNADKPSEFNIRLMQEGRMKGQAFVTLDSIEMAQKAVNETNGFILKDKPLVVAFGKAGTKKK